MNETNKTNSKKSALVTVLSAFGLVFGFLALALASIPLLGVAVFPESIMSLRIPLLAIRYMIFAVNITTYCLGAAAMLLCLAAFITAHAKRVSKTLPACSFVVGLLAVGFPTLIHSLYGSTLDLLPVLPNKEMRIEKYRGISAGKPQRDTSIRTPLMEAAEAGQIERVKELLKEGADPREKPGNSWSAFGLAISKGRIEIAKIFLEHQPTETDKAYLGQMLKLTAIHNKKEIAVLLLEHKPEIDVKCGDCGRTPVMHTLDWGNLDMARFLLDNGADMNARNPYGWTMLTIAAYNNKLDFVQELIDRGADLDAKTNDGMTALMWAANEGHIDVVDTLLAAGANPNIASKNRQTAMKYAACGGHTDIVRLLARSGAQR